MTSPSQSVAPCICGKPGCDIPYGYCHCRCGRKSPVQSRNVRAKGWIKGEPSRYAIAHGRASERVYFQDEARFKIDGDYCRLIPLSRGLYSIVTESDYEYLMQWIWSANWNKCIRAYYAVRNPGDGEGNSSVTMHQQIMSRYDKDDRQVDHRDPLRTTENTRKNLRYATSSQQKMNMRMRMDNTSGCKGVCFHITRGLWTARIGADKKAIFLGYFLRKEDAIKARRDAERKYHGEFRREK